MRIMVGLTPPTSGTATIDGRRFADLPNPGLEVGVLLDASAQHAGRTGREILTDRPAHHGPARAAGSTRCSTWSASPTTRPTAGSATTRSACASGSASPPPCSATREVLILDEPANGLDPAGIRWMRDLLRGYADQGGTVLLSSHLLHEIEVIADDLVVIGNGRIVAQGTKAELLAAAGTVVRAADAAGLARALQRRRRHGHPVRRRRPAHRRRPRRRSARSRSRPASP